MWPVSQRFLDALAVPHKLVTESTVTPPGADPIPLQPKAGSVSVDSAARIRRKARLTAYGSGAEFEALSTDGAIVEIRHGIDFGDVRELVPVFHGEVVDGSQNLGTDSIDFAAADLGQRVARTRFLTPFSPAPSLTRVQVIGQVLAGSTPAAGVIVEATDTGMVGEQVWAESASDCIQDLATDGSMEAFFRPDGAFLIRDQVALDASPVWTLAGGDGGTLEEAERRRPKDRLYNTVVVRPSAADGSQTWTQQVVQVTDPTSPRHPDKIGVVPYFWSSPTIRTAEAALAAGVKILDRVLGTTETLSLSAVLNPALEAGEAIRVIVPARPDAPARIYQHFIDALSLDLVSGGMSIDTRKQVATDAQ